ncbi:MAG: PAS domain-containing protein [Omnitrophica WOR_2 bacterium]
MSSKLEKIAQRLAPLAAASEAVSLSGPASVDRVKDQSELPAEQRERKLEDLQQCAERFRAYIPALTGVFYEWDLQTDKLARIGEIDQKFHTDVEDVVDYPIWLALIKKEDRKTVEPVLDEVKQGKRDGYALEYHIRNADGKWMVLWDRAILERDAEGRPLRAVGSLEDITNLKQLEHSLSLSNKAMAESNIRLRKKEAQVDTILANSPVAFFQTDLDLRYIWIYNPILDLKPEQFIGKLDNEIFPAKDAADLLAIKQTVLDYQVPVRREIILSSREPQKVLFVSAQPLFNKDKKITGVVGACVDLTEQRILENRASQKAFQLELNRRLMAHRDQQRQIIGKSIQEGAVQSLSGMVFSMQLARQLFPGQESLKIIEDIRGRIKNLVVELREMSKELQPASLPQYGLERAIRSYTANFQERNPEIHVQFSLKGDFASLPDPMVQAIYNVVEESFYNIVHHAQASEVQVNLAVEPHHPILLDIIDNGCGFELQSDWMGLIRRGCYGLIRMKEATEGVGGAITVKSAPGHGTSIHVAIPYENELIPAGR